MGEKVNVPDELEIGFLVERFNQTPYQLGLSETNDLALLSRSLRAVEIYRIAQRASRDLSSLTPDEFRVIKPILDEIKKKDKPKHRRRR